MAVNETKQGLLTKDTNGLPGGRTTTGRDYIKLPHPACLTILYVHISGGTATLDIEVSDDPANTKFFPIKTVSENGVHRISMPSSIVAVNVTAISGATVEVRYRVLVLDNAPEYAIDTFQEGDIVARRISIEGDVLATFTENFFRKKLAQTQVAASATTVYTAPADKQVAIKHMILVNPTANDRIVTLWHDGSADANMILPPTTIVAGGHAIFSGELQMDPSDTLVADADSATAVTLTVYGLEQPLPE